MRPERDRLPESVESVLWLDDRQELSVKSAVPQLGWLQLLGKVSNGMPFSVDVLLEHRSNGSVGGIRHDVGRGPSYGCARRVAWASISLIVETAVAASSLHAMLLVLLLQLERS